MRICILCISVFGTMYSIHQNDELECAILCLVVPHPQELIFTSRKPSPPPPPELLAEKCYGANRQKPIHRENFHIRHNASTRPPLPLELLAARTKGSLLAGLELIIAENS